MKLNPQFITNEQGVCVYAVLTIEDYREVERRVTHEPSVEMAVPEVAVVEATDVLRMFVIHEKGVIAHARYENRMLIIQKGSEASEHESESLRTHCASCCKKRRDLLQSGALVLYDGKLRFMENIECDTPKEAASLICGYPRNGWKAFEGIDGRPMKDVLDDRSFFRRRRG